MYNQHRNQAIDNRVMENQAKAAQLSEQIKRQQAKNAPQRPKNVRGAANSNSGSAQGAPVQAPNQKQRARV